MDARGLVSRASAVQSRFESDQAFQIRGLQRPRRWASALTHGAGSRCTLRRSSRRFGVSGLSIAGRSGKVTCRSRTFSPCSSRFHALTKRFPDAAGLVAELTESEAVPYLAALRYTEDGMRKRVAWEQTWALQRREDDVDARVAARTLQQAGESDESYQKRLADAQRAARREEMGEVPVPVPPKYSKADFRNGTYWGLRGALDVPKERFVSVPLASPAADNSLMLAWAGWDHLRLAQALAAHYLHLKDHEAWEGERLKPLLAGLLEQVPWLKQWHNELDPAHGARMGDYFEGFVQDEARGLGLTMDDLRGWRPPVTATRRRRANAAP